MLFHVLSFILLIVDQKCWTVFYLFQYIWHMYLIFLDVTTLVTRLYRSLFEAESLLTEKGFVKLLIAAINCCTPLSSLATIEAERLWCCSGVCKDTPAMDIASEASFANSGSVRKNFGGALSFCVIPTSPPDTFMARFRCSKALSSSTAQQHTCW